MKPTKGGAIALINELMSFFALFLYLGLGLASSYIDPYKIWIGCSAGAATPCCGCGGGGSLSLIEAEAGATGAICVDTRVKRTLVTRERSSLGEAVIEKIRKEGADPMDEDNDQRKLSAIKLDGIEEGYANMDGLPGN
ncbi:hypothetical protein HID58_042888 [Brassica napus]|uniref:Uncharacterized protein n=1 Tax=Brassica napus TaxID=3708 RepID=A0ABQ8BGL3_BRANA|nr:hypothetical protein HID58_042888 [Brassica napus]